MLILLPPSEGKSPPDEGPPLALGALSLPRLTAARRKVLTALVRLCRDDPTEARTVLGLSPRQADEVTRNSHLRRAPTAPAASVYSGVLYAALDPAGAEPAARARMADWILVWSGLWGALRLDDPIPAYRLSGSVNLPGPGRLATFWKPHLTRALRDLSAGQLVLDLRSGPYAASWVGPVGSTVTGRIIHERAGRQAVASHFNKATKGRMVRALAHSGAQPQNADELVDALRALGFTAELATNGSRQRLDLVVDSL